MFRKGIVCLEDSPSRCHHQRTSLFDRGSFWQLLGTKCIKTW